MKRLVTALLAALGGSLSTAGGLAADAQQTAAGRSQAQITEPPKIERTADSWAIIRWTTNNIKGTSLRYGVVHYGTDPHDLGFTARSPNRWNPGLPSMIYRVQINHLDPATTYYYQVESQNALNVNEGAESSVNHFTTERSP
jgi:Purple acid Phosphatase, N-terminal domain